jgi:thiamine-phosphate pyrophosphorylase
MLGKRIADRGKDEETMRKLRLGLYVVTGAYPELGRDHLDIARVALEGGADVLQLRDKDAGGGEMLRLALGMRDMVDKSRADCLLMVNDRVDVALAARSDGIHLGQDDLPAVAVRPMVGREMIMGISASTIVEAKRAQAEGADYLGVGPVFATPTKRDAGNPIGLDALRAIAKAVDVPVVAIGGINEENVIQVLEAGADGIAVISAIAAAEDMLKVVLQLRKAVDAYIPGR